MLLKMAWRNLWRNRRRSFITMASVFFAVVLSTLMTSMKEGTYNGMINSTMGSYSGYVQIHAKGYQREKTLDYVFSLPDSVATYLTQNPFITHYLPRIESFALGAGRHKSKGVMVCGVDFELEKKAINLNERVYEGAYPSQRSTGIVLGQGLAEYLKLDVGDSLVLLGQGFHGAMAAGIYPIEALVKFGSPDLSKQLVFMPLSSAQYLFDLSGRVNSINIMIQNPGHAQKLAQTMGKALGEAYEVMPWQEFNPELIKMIETDRVEAYVFMVILYTIIGFGIFSTILMMLMERRKEFGVMVAIGLKRVKLSVMVWMEIVLLSFMGALLGMLGAFPVCYYFYIFPVKFGKDIAKVMEDYGMEAVLRSSIDVGIFAQQTLIVIVIACLLSIYPFVKLLGIRSIENMRG